MRVALLSETETIRSCWICFATDVSFPFLSPHYQSRRVIKFETISSCWTWYVIDFFCIFNLTEQWESPCYQILKQYQVAGIGLVPFYQTLKQYNFPGLGMLLMFRFLFYHPTIRVAMLLNLKQYLVAGLGMVLNFFCIFNLTEQWESSCYQTLKQYQVLWNWYATDVSFPYLSTHYQSRRVIRN